VDSTLSTLEEAIKELVKYSPPIDKTALNAAIQSAEAKIESDYTAASWIEFTRTLEAARAIAEEEEAAQNDVDIMAAALEDAIKTLEKVPLPVEADKTALNAAIQSAEEKKETEYTESSWIEFAQALKAAKEIAEEADVSQDEVDSMLVALENAIKALEKVPLPVEADKTALNAAIQSAKEKKETEYTESSWIEFAQVLKAAKEIAEEAEVPQDEVDSMLAALENAIKALEKVPLPVEKADKTALNAAIQSAEEKKETEYTESSWIEFAQALKAAKEIAEEADVAQDEVDSKLAALEDTIKALEKVSPPVDKTALNAAIHSAEGKKQSNYTKDSWNLFTAALKEAKVIAAKSTAAQPEAAAAANKLEQASKALIVIKVISRKTVTLGRKETFKTYVSGKRKDCYFVSSNDKIAKVSSKGVVTAIKKGKATITAVNKNGNAVTLKVTVKKSPSKILKLNAVEKTLKKNQTFKIKYKLPNNTASHKITYKSSNRTVATVNKKGKVTAKKKGKTTISVKTYNGRIKKLKIIVN